MNEQNLIPNSQRTPSELREMRSKGGKVSGERRREKKMMQEICLKMLNASLSDEQAAQLGLFNLKKGDLTWNAAIIAKQINKAVKGDTASAKFLQDLSGQKEAEKLELSGGTHNEVVVAKDQITADIYNSIMNGNGD